MNIKNKLIIFSNIILCILAILFFNVEYQYSSDVSRNIGYAEFFISNNYNVLDLTNYLINQKSIESNIILAIFIYSLGLLINNLALVFFIMNFVITISLFYVVYKDFDEQKIDIFYYHIFGYLFFLNPDLKLWQSFLLFDYFCALLIFIYVRYLIKEKILLSILLLCFLVLIRPTSIFVIPITVLYIFFNYFLKLSNYKQIIFLILSAIFVFISFSLIFIYIDDLSFIASRLNFYKDSNLSGLVVHDRWSINFDVNNFFRMFFLFLIKFFAFHQFISSDFSLIHNIYNLIYYIPYLTITLVIFKNIFFNHKFEYNKYYRIGFYFVIVYSVCHAILLIDYDWRYRTPLYIPLIICIVYFLHEIKFYNLIKSKLKKVSFINKN